MSAMVDRVARAIGVREAEIMLGAPPGVCADTRELARAAIAAMREPTDAMVDAAVEFTSDAPTGRRQSVRVWQAMIDAALKGDPT